MGQKQLITCDSCDQEIAGQAVAKVTVEEGGRVREGDLCATCAPKIPTSRVRMKAGRRPKERVDELAVRREQAPDLAGALAVS